MFTLRCTTCDARLGVQDETLIGQILACPKCGSMVHVVPSGAVPREPETVPPDMEPGTMFPESGPQVPALELLSESELRVRKILLVILAGFVLFLVVAIGILFSRGKPSEPQPAVAGEEPGPVVPVSHELQPAVVPPVVVVPMKPEESGPSEDVPVQEIRTPETQASETEMPESKEPEYRLKGETEIRSTTDLLADLERKLPGLVELPAALTVDVPDRLRLPLNGFKLDKTSLVAAVRTLSRLTEVPITLDVDEFRCRGIDFDAPISGTYEPGTVGETLIDLLKPLGLEPVIEDRQIFVTVPLEERDKLTEKTFDIADLADSDENLTPQRLTELVRQLVDPVGLSAEEPTPDQPSIKVDGTALIVRHRLRKLDETLRLLEQLRVLRKLPQKTKIEGERLVPEVFGWDAVQAPLTLNYYQPILLGEVFPQLEAAAKIRILVDHKALNRALSPFSSLKGTVGNNNGTVDTALERLLASVDGVTLTYRIVNVDVLEITTRDVAGRSEKMSVEVHRYETPEHPLEDNATPEELVRTIRTALEHNSWYDPGNSETLGLGDIVIDQPSGCLIVRQSQGIQRLLRRWFAGRN